MTRKSINLAITRAEEFLQRVRQEKKSICFINSIKYAELSDTFDHNYIVIQLLYYRVIISQSFFFKLQSKISGDFMLGIIQVSEVL